MIIGPFNPVHIISLSDKKKMYQNIMLKYWYRVSLFFLAKVIGPKERVPQSTVKIKFTPSSINFEKPGGKLT